MAKGTGGPAGDEAQNLVVSQTAHSSRDLGIEAEGGGVFRVGLSECLCSHPEESEFVSCECDGGCVCHPSEYPLPAQFVKAAIGFNARQADLAPAYDTGHPIGAVAFAQNQRDELRELDQASSLNAERWGTAKNETLLAVLQEVGGRESKNQNGVGIGVTEDTDVCYTLQAGQQHGVAVAEIQTRGRGEHVQDEIDTSGVAQALRAGDGGSSRSKKIITTTAVRRLTPLECERLQGFPDGWTDIPGNSDTQRYRQLGNAVAVPVVEWIMKRIGTV